MSLKLNFLKEGVMMLVFMLLLLLPGVGLAQSKEAAEVTLFEGQGLMQALVGAGYDFRLYTELRKVTPDGDAVECGSPSKFEIRSMQPQILWLPAGAKVNQTRLKQCLAVENELFGNKQVIAHQPTPKPRAVRVPVPKPAPPTVVTPKKQPAPKREISEARPVAPAKKQPAPKPAVIPAPKVQTKVLDSKSMREAEQMLRSELGKTSRLVPPAPAPKKAALPAKDHQLESLERQILKQRIELQGLSKMAGEMEKETLGQKAGEPKVQVKVPVPAQLVEKKPITVLPKTQRPDPLLAAYNSRIAYQKRELAEVAKRASKREAEAARVGEIRWVADKSAKSPRDLPFDWNPVYWSLGVLTLCVLLSIITMKIHSSMESRRQQEQEAWFKEHYSTGSGVVSPITPAVPLTAGQLAQAAHASALKRRLTLVNRENKAS